MNIELRRRADPLSPRISAGVNDNVDERLTRRVQRRVVIFRPAKSATTSGRGRTKRWLLEFEPNSGPFIEPLIGCAGSADPLANMQLSFGSRDAAVAYAERHGLEYEVREPAQSGRLGTPAEPADQEANPPAAATPVTIDLAA